MQEVDEAKFEARRKHRGDRDQSKRRMNRLEPGHVQGEVSPPEGRGLFGTDEKSIRHGDFGCAVFMRPEHCLIRAGRMPHDTTARHLPQIESASRVAAATRHARVSRHGSTGTPSSSGHPRHQQNGPRVLRTTAAAPRPARQAARWPRTGLLQGNMIPRTRMEPSGVATRNTPPVGLRKVGN